MYVCIRLDNLKDSDIRKSALYSEVNKPNW